MGSIDVRSQWDDIQAGDKKRSMQEQLPEGEYRVVIESLKFFEANENLSACLAMKLEVVGGDRKGESISYKNYLNSRKAIVYFRTAIKKLIPSAFEMNFDEVLSSLKAASGTRQVIRVSLSYSSNGNGTQYTNVKIIGIEDKVEQVNTMSESPIQEPF